MSLSSVYGMMMKVHQVDLFKTIGDNIAGSPLPDQTAAPPAQPGLDPSKLLQQPNQVGNPPSLLGQTPTQVAKPEISSGVAALDTPLPETETSATEFGLNRFKGPTANSLSLVGLRPPLMPRQATRDSLGAMADSFRNMLDETRSPGRDARIPTQKLATSGLDISTLIRTYGSGAPSLNNNVAPPVAAHGPSDLSDMGPASDPSVHEDNSTSPRLRAADGPITATPASPPAPTGPRFFLPSAPPSLDFAEPDLIADGLLPQLPKAQTGNPARLKLSDGGDNIVAVPDGVIDDPKEIRPDLTFTLPVTDVAGGADVDHSKGNDPSLFDRSETSGTGSNLATPEKPDLQTRTDARSDTGRDTGQGKLPADTATTKAGTGVSSEDNKPMRSDSVEVSRVDPGTGLDDLGALPHTHAAEVVEMAVGGSILNAAMIPGWPPPRAFATNMIRELISAESKDAAEQNLLIGLKALGIGKSLLEKLKAKLTAIKRRLEVLIGLGVLYASIMAVMEALAEELALISEEEEDAQRGTGHGGRNRISD